MALKFDVSLVDVEDMLSSLEIENISQATEHEFKFSCPFPGHMHGDQNPSAYMNIESTAFLCHGCHRKGNAVTFLAELEGITTLLANRFLQERYGGVGSDPDAYSARVELEKLWEKNARVEEPNFDPPLAEEVMDDFSIDWHAAAKVAPEVESDWFKYIFDRGFTPDTLVNWEIGYCDDTNRIAIPVRDVNGDLVGFKGRAWRDHHKPKYLVLQPRGLPRYHVARNVFGLYRAEGTHLIVVEGELNVVAMWQMGYRNVVAINGSNFSDRHEFLLRNYADKVTIFLDSNDAGYDGTLKIVNSLGPHMPIDVVPDHDFDAADCINPEKEADESSVRRLLQEAQSEITIRLTATFEG
jgi:DNA primase